jgi:hypothetical protein
MVAANFKMVCPPATSEAGAKWPRCRLGSVAGPVIQATGKSTFEDGLRSGGSGSDLKHYHKMSAPGCPLVIA